MAIVDTLPSTSLLLDYSRPGDYLDCYSVAFSNAWARNEATMIELATLCLLVDVKAMMLLLKLRNAIVKPLGLKTPKDLSPDTVPARDKQVGDHIGFFRIYRIDDNEIMLGEDDIHQDFRVTITRSTTTPATLYMSTCCQRHNWFGHFYLAAILPFHKYGVTQLLNGAAKKLAAAGDAAVATTGRA